MNDKKHYQQYVNAVEYSQHLEQLLSVELKNTSALLAKLEAAERERDEMRASLIAASNMQSIHRDACQKAEAEIARRDAAAGEPVAWQYRYNDGKVGDWKTVDSESECNHSPCYERRAIYTAALPAVLPYLSDDTLREMVSAYNIANHSIEAYQEMRAAMGRGAQQQKVVELYKRKSMEVIGGGGQRYSYVLMEDLLPELDAANVKWEVKK